MSTVKTDGQIDAVYTDLRKAFETVNFNMLLSYLKVIGIHGSLLNWFGFYLVNKQQQVKINEKLSYVIDITSGVPQECHLSP